MNTIALFVVLLVAVFAEDYDAPRGRVSPRGCVFPNIPQNLNVRTQGKGRIMRFICSAGTLLVGKRFSTCLRGRWSSPPPICLSKGCSPQTAPPNGRVIESYDGGMLTFGCNPGYIQNGTSTIYCILPEWNGTAPTCTVPTINANVSCDFEDPDLCGWSHDVTHDFEWKRNKFSTPSGHVGTGPSFDHTLGKGLNGHYMYLEASAPQKLGDVTRLFSPVYPTALSGSCFTFWYHMYGSSIGSLRVYLKEENQVLAELSPAWRKDQETGNFWLQGQIDVPQIAINFQLVIEGVRGTDYMGDIAVDDVSLNPGSCPVQINQSEPIQGNVTSATTTDEGGGPGERTSQNSTQPTTEAYTREVTTNLLLTTATKEQRTVETTPPITSGTLSTRMSPSAITSERMTDTISTSKVELTSAKTETTTLSPTRPQPTDCIIDKSNSSQSTDQNWVISLSNCSTSPQVNTSETTEVPTVGYRYTTIPSKAVTTSPSTPRKITQRYTYLSSTALQLTTTLNPTTKSRFIFTKFTKQTQMTTPSLPMVTTTMRRTAYPKSTLGVTTKASSFIIENPTTTTTTTAPTTAPAATTTTTSKMKFTSSITQSNAPTTTTITTPVFVPGSSILTTTTTSSVTTTKATASPGTTTTRTKKPFISIVPKTTLKVTNNPLGSTTQSRQFKSTSTFSPTTQSSTTTKESTTKRRIPFFPPKQVTTPSSTTDIRDLFPNSSDSYSDEDEDNHSRQNDDSVLDTVSEPESETEPESSARWQEFPRRPHPHEKPTSGAGTSAIVTACSLGVLGLVVTVFAIINLVRRRKLKQQRYGSNSEMRYITQSEELELGLPDNNDTLKLL